MIDSTNSEMAFIGSLFNMADDKPINELYRYVLSVDESEFSSEFCAAVYRYVKQSVNNETGFDVVSIYEDLEASKEYAGKFAFSDIGQVVRSQSGYSAIDSHVKNIKQASLQRKSIEVLTGLCHSIADSENIVQALGNAESAIDSLMQKANGESSGMTHITDLIRDWVQRAEEQYSGKEVEKGFTTGFESADFLIGDDLLLPGSLLVIGANPGKGKTALMVAMSTAIAEQYKDRHCQVYSLEMPSAQITDRMMGRVVQNKKPKHYQDADWGLISNQMERLQSTSLYVSDTPVLSVEQIKMNARAVIGQGGRISAIFVDYLTLMKLPKADRHDLSVGEVTKQCKRLAKELNCLVVLLAQLSRSNMQRANKRPINSDLRDSGQIEQDADYILFPYYDYLFDPDSQCGPYAELIWSKNRHGNSGVTFAKVVNGVWTDVDQQEAKCRIGGDN